MDPSSYIQVPTARGFKYHVYRVKATDTTKPTILFAHGFPCNSYSWRHQVTYFKALGYGLLVPDMLGYGGTDKPTNVEVYAPSLMAKDLLDIVDAEKEDRVVAVGHDWGSKVVSRLANLYPDRFLGFAMLALGYYPPNPIPFPDFLAYTASVAGYVTFGYWNFFAEDGADKIIHDHLDLFVRSFVGMPQDRIISDLCRPGAFKAWILANGTVPDLPVYLTKEEDETQKAILQRDGITAPLFYYKAATSSVDMEDSKLIPLDKYTITKPVFYGAAVDDLVCLPELGKDTMKKYCVDSTVKEYDAGHWFIWHVPDALNTDLHQWIGKFSK